VLGGGGAKGAAHVGVLGVLEELRIPIDCIVGTSMSALVGGTFA
jgi:NTE family protein